MEDYMNVNVYFFSLDTLQTQTPKEIKLGSKKIKIEVVNEIDSRFSLNKIFLIKDDKDVLYEKKYFTKNDIFLVRANKNAFKLNYFGTKFLFEDQYKFSGRWIRNRIFSCKL